MQIIRFLAGVPISALVVAVSVLSIAVALIFFLLGKKIGQLEYERTTAGVLRAERADAVKRSRAVLAGQLAEHVAPFLPGFPCNPADVRFIGKPIDFIAFPGAAEGRTVTEVVFIEVKSGGATLSAREKEIRAAIEMGRVRYVEYHL
ncbi:MAG: hypothetical protein IJ191_07350 [Treponema sp.]|nr:hypothetical protein [Treponema sp.]